MNNLRIGVAGSSKKESLHYLNILVEHEKQHKNFDKRTKEKIFCTNGIEYTIIPTNSLGFCGVRFDQIFIVGSYVDKYKTDDFFSMFIRPSLWSGYCCVPNEFKLQEWAET